MTRWIILLEKKSHDGDTRQKWCIAGTRKHRIDKAEATCKIDGSYFGKKPDGGPVAFIAQCIVVWECADEVNLSAENRHIIERWANGDFVIGSAG